MLINIAEGLLESIRRELVSSLAQAEDEFLNFIELEDGDIPENVHKELHNAGCVLYALNDKKASQATAILVDALRSNGGAKKAQEQDELIDLFLSLQKHVDGLSLDYSSSEIDSVLSHFDNTQSYQWEADDVTILRQGHKLLQKLASDGVLGSEAWQKVYKLCALLLAKCQSKEIYQLLWKSQLVAVLSIKGELSLSQADQIKFIDLLGHFFNVLAELGESSASSGKSAGLAQCLDTVLADVDLKSDNVQVTYKPPVASLKSSGEAGKLLFSVSKSTIDSIAFLVKKEVSVCKSRFESFLIADSNEIKVIRSDIVASLKQVYATFKLLGNHSAVELVANTLKIIERLKPEAGIEAAEFAKNIVLIENVLWELDYQKQTQVGFASSTEEYMAHASSISVSGCKRSVSGLAVQFFAKSLDEIIAKKSLKEIDFFGRAELLHNLASSLLLFNEGKGHKLLAKTEQAFLFLVNESEAKKENRVLLNALLDLLISYQMLFEAYQSSLVFENRSFELAGRNLQKLLAVINFDESKVAQADYQQYTSSDSFEIDESVLKEEIGLDEQEDNSSVGNGLTGDGFDIDTFASPVFAESAVQQAVSSKSDIQSMQSGEIDQEVFEIFLEEAKSIEETLLSYLPTLDKEIFSDSTQGEIRQAFHTLKGSGRMVGLNVFGEYAWQHEELLNKLMAGSYAANHAIAEQIESAVGVLQKVLAAKPFKEDRNLLLNSAAKAELLRRSLLGEDIPQESKAGVDTSIELSSNQQSLSALDDDDIESNLSDSDIQRIAAEIAKKQSQNLSDSLSNLAAHEALSGEGGAEDDLRLENQLKNKSNTSGVGAGQSQDAETDPSKGLPDNLQKFLEDTEPEIEGSQKNFSDWRSSRYLSDNSLSSLQQNISNINRSSSETNYTDGEKLTDAIGKSLSDFSEKRVEATDSSTEIVKTALDDLERMHADLSVGGDGKLNESVFDRLWEGIVTSTKIDETGFEGDVPANKLDLEAQLIGKPAEAMASSGQEIDPSKNLPNNLQQYIQDTAPEIESSKKNFGDWRSSEYQSESSLSSLQENISNINRSSSDVDYKSGEKLTEAVGKALSDFSEKRVEATDASTEIVKDAINDLERMHSDLASGGEGNPNNSLFEQLWDSFNEEASAATSRERGLFDAVGLELQSQSTLGEEGKSNGLETAPEQNLPKNLQQFIRDAAPEIKNSKENFGDWRSSEYQSEASLSSLQGNVSNLNKSSNEAHYESGQTLTEAVGKTLSDFANKSIDANDVSTEPVKDAIDDLERMHSDLASGGEGKFSDQVLEQLQNVSGKRGLEGDIGKATPDILAESKSQGKSTETTEADSLGVSPNQSLPRSLQQFINDAAPAIESSKESFGDWRSSEYQSEASLSSLQGNVSNLNKSSNEAHYESGQTLTEAVGKTLSDFANKSIDANDVSTEPVKDAIDDLERMHSDLASGGEGKFSDQVLDRLQNVAGKNAESALGEGVEPTVGQEINEHSREEELTPEHAAKRADSLDKLNKVADTAQLLANFDEFSQDDMAATLHALSNIARDSLPKDSQEILESIEDIQSKIQDDWSNMFTQNMAKEVADALKSAVDGQAGSKEKQQAKDRLDDINNAFAEKTISNTSDALDLVKQAQAMHSQSLSFFDEWDKEDYAFGNTLKDLASQSKSIESFFKENQEFSAVEPVTDKTAEALEHVSQQRRTPTRQVVTVIRQALSEVSTMLDKFEAGNWDSKADGEVLDSLDNIISTLKSSYDSLKDELTGEHTADGASDSGEAQASDEQYQEGMAESKEGDASLGADKDSKPSTWIPEKLKQFVDETSSEINASRANMDSWEESEYQDDDSLSGLQSNVDKVNRSSDEANYKDGAALTGAMSEALSQFASKEVEATDETTAPVKDALSDLERMHADVASGGDGDLDEAAFSSLLSHNQRTEQDISTDDIFGETVSGEFGDYGDPDNMAKDTPVRWASPKLQGFFEETTPVISSLRSNMDEWVASDYRNESSLSGLQSNISDVNRSSSKAEYEDAEALTDAMSEAFSYFADKQMEATDKTTTPVKDALSDLERMHSDIGKGGQGNLNQSAFFNLASQNQRAKESFGGIYGDTSSDIMGEAVGGPFGNYGFGDVEGGAATHIEQPVQWASPKLQGFFEEATPAISSLRSGMDDWAASEYKNEASLAGLQDNLAKVGQSSSKADYEDAETLTGAMSEALSQFANKEAVATDETTAPVKDALSDLERMHSDIAKGGQGNLDKSILSSLAAQNEDVVIKYTAATALETGVDNHSGVQSTGGRKEENPLDKLKKIADTAQLLANFDEFSQEDMGATLNALSNISHDGLSKDSQEILESIEDIQLKVEGDWKSNFTQNVAKELSDSLATAVNPEATQEEKRQAKEKLDQINNAFGEKTISSTSDALGLVEQAKEMHSQSMSLFDEWDKSDYAHGKTLESLVENTLSVESFFKENQQFANVEPVTDKTTEALDYISNQQSKPTKQIVVTIKQALTEVSSILDEFTEGNWEAKADDEVLESLDKIISTLKLSYDSLKQQITDDFEATAELSDVNIDNAAEFEASADVFGQAVSGPFGRYGEEAAETPTDSVQWASPKLQHFFEQSTPAISSLRSGMDDWVASDYKNEDSLASLQSDISKVNKSSSEAEYEDAEALTDAMSEALSLFADKQVEATDETTSSVKDALSDLERMHSDIAEGGQGHLDESILSNLAAHNENATIRYRGVGNGIADKKGLVDTAAPYEEKGSSIEESFKEFAPEQNESQSFPAGLSYPKANISRNSPISQKVSDLSESLVQAAKSQFSQQQVDNLVEELYDIEDSIDEKDAPSWSWEMSSALESMLQAYGALQVPPNYSDLKKMNQALEAITQPDSIDNNQAKALINDLMNCRANIDKRKQLSDDERYFNNSVARYLEKSFYDYSDWQDSDFLAEEPLDSLRQNVQEIESTAKETHFNDVENLSNSMGLMLDRVKSEKVRPNEQVTDAISSALNSVGKTVENVGLGLGGDVPKEIKSELNNAIFSADIGQPISQYQPLHKPAIKAAEDNTDDNDVLDQEYPGTEVPVGSLNDSETASLGVSEEGLDFPDTMAAEFGEEQAERLEVADEAIDETEEQPISASAEVSSEEIQAANKTELPTDDVSELELNEDNTQIRLDEKTYERLLQFANSVEPSINASTKNYSDWKAADYDFNEDFSALRSNIKDINSEAKQSEFSEAESISANIDAMMGQLEQNKAKPSEESSAGIEQGIGEIKNAVEDIHAEKMPTISEDIMSSLDALMEGNIFADAGESVSAKIADNEAEAAEASLSSQAESSTEELINQSEQYASLDDTQQTSELEDRKYNDPAQLDQTILEIFLSEAKDILESNRNSLTAWIGNKNNLTALHEIQRGMHTLKGGSRMAELTIFGDLAHYLESLLDLLVAGRINDKKEAQQILTQGMDLSDSIVSTVSLGRLIYEDEKFIHHLLKFIEGETGVPSEVESRDTAVASVKSDKPRAKKETRQKASYSVRIQSDLIEKLVNLVGEDVITRARIDRNNTQHEFQLTELSKATDRLAEQMRRLDNETEAQILFRREALSDENEDFDPLELDRFSEIQQLSRSLTETILDLQNIKGSLIGYVEDSKVLLSDQANIQHEVQKELLSATLVRFDSIRTRIERIVEQVSRELGKDVSIQIYGGQVEIERNMLEDLLPGFEHTIRNSLVHGIELPEERDIKGKPRQGKIRIGVRREGAEIWFVIADDGSGADHDKIRNKARSLGILDESKANDKSYLLSLMFEQGLSTAQKTTQVAGRGIGLDVLKEVVNARQGSIEVETESDKGMAVSIRMPFTLSVTDALIIKTGQFAYAIPMVSVEGVGRISHNELLDFMHGEEVYHRYGQYKYRLYSLSGYLDPYFERQPSSFGPPVLLTRIGNERLALEVSEIMGRQEILIKSVNSQITAVPGIIGATILDDGSPVGVLEVATLGRQLMSFIQSGANIKDYIADIGTHETYRQKRILVVDDSITMRKITCKILEKYNVETQTAKDGLEAVDVLLDWTPDLILLDIEMPRMDGFELATHVRNEDTLKGLPIIMITSRTGEKHRKRAEAIGVNGYLGKPYTEEILIESIESVLGQSMRI